MTSVTENKVIAEMTPVLPPCGLNDDQKEIWNQYQNAVILAIKKNHAYGSSVFKKGPLTPELSADATIRVRMGDKISRMANLMDDPAKNMIGDESLNDTIRDLGTYCFLLLIARDREAKAATLKKAAESKSTPPNTTQYLAGNDR